MIIDHWNTGFVYIDCADTLQVHLVFCTYFQKIFMVPECEVLPQEAEYVNILFIKTSSLHVFFDN